MNYNIEIICNSLLCLGALAGFLYSLIKFFKPKKAMYKKMVGCALGCLFMERLYEIVQYVIVGDLPALAAPLAAAAAAVAILLSPSDPGRRITCAIEMLFVGASAYYSLKHLIIPKEYSDFLSSMRPFHALSLLLAAGTIIEDTIWCYQVNVQAVWYIPYAILLFSMLALAPALERGTKQWLT